MMVTNLNDNLQSLVATFGTEFDSQLVAVALCGSAVDQPESASDLDILVLIKGSYSQRRRIRKGDIDVDVFIEPVDKIALALKNFPVLINLLRGSRPLYDPFNLVARFKGMAAHIAASGYVIPETLMFRALFEPGDYMRKLSRASDDTEFNYIAPFFVRACLTTYFEFSGVMQMDAEKLLAYAKQEHPEIHEYAHAILNGRLSKAARYIVAKKLLCVANEKRPEQSSNYLGPKIRYIRPHPSRSAR